MYTPQKLIFLIWHCLVKTAAQWRKEKGISGKTPNIRDFASAEELVVLINLEDSNADLIRQEVPQIDRLKILREKAYRQRELLKKNQETFGEYHCFAEASTKSPY